MSAGAGSLQPLHGTRTDSLERLPSMENVAMGSKPGRGLRLRAVGLGPLSPGSAMAVGKEPEGVYGYGNGQASTEPVAFPESVFSLKSWERCDTVPIPTPGFVWLSFFGLSGLKIRSEYEDFLNVIIYIMNSWTNSNGKVIKPIQGHFSEILASEYRVTEGAG